ncbi:MAG: FAD-dependent oxidoreductase, partial [Gammaproteobacteria bacterium]|nr:FAD-dependent oxidoreductase [Gammaproteobacteria bacterium]
ADGGEAYSKPGLSTAVARRQQADELIQKDAASLALEFNCEIHTRTRVTAIDRRRRRLSLEAGRGAEQLDYDKLVLALGADARVFPTEGSETLDIATVNDLDDYRRWRERIGDQGRILLIGAGLIGCEFANDLGSVGFQVNVVDPAPWPLARLLPQVMGEMLVDALQQTGCRFHLGRKVVRYLSSASGPIAQLDDGTRIAFDHALSAVGLAPRTQLAKAAGLETGAGIITDRQMRTSDPHIFALGDCVQTDVGPLPFIAPLLAQVSVLADSLSKQHASLQLPALPVLVKTPALALVVCPPPPGSSGDWQLEISAAQSAKALFCDPEGNPLGFALCGEQTQQQKELAKTMPYLLPPKPRYLKPVKAKVKPQDMSHHPHECLICRWVYDPAVGDPENGVAPGTPWSEVPDDWICPGCGAYKDDFALAA